MKKQNLTPLAFILGIMVSALFASCEEREQEINLAENEAQRQEVYEQILSDDELFNEFMEEMTEDRNMMRNMYTREQVEASMMADPEVMDSVLVGVYAVMEKDSMLMRNPERRERMMQNMTRMMERDTAMYMEMQERMEEGRMNE
ncbi:hypothetical protein [Salinimicrobium sediminilitoris]|uniref:hypothetical protein n=1 Tax=Salinimicrobium sediminilitoris TaxID=2876715 RepID=UPI001E585728|nr:hypothetical protein [Salinimicrobium sediminilitoris]MCC8360197.1 hypothetical protein [Salinimicrobium sediminilitoris]